MRTCGDCSMCCKVFDDIVDLPEKPHGGWCPHCEVGGRRCTIYASRPAACRKFECVWLQNEKGLPDWLKPNKCRVVVNSPDGNYLCLHPDPSMPDAWRRPDVLGYFMQLSRHVTIGVVAGTPGHYRYYQILPGGPIDAEGRQMPDGSHKIITIKTRLPVYPA